METAQGVGLTRSGDLSVPLHGFLIKTAGVGVIKEFIRAADLKEAAYFLSHRYPNAISIEPIKQAPKPILNVKEGTLLPCPKCSQRHKVLAANSPDQKLNFIFCRSVKRFIAVGLDGRYLPQVN